MRRLSAIVTLIVLPMVAAAADPVPNVKETINRVEDGDEGADAVLLDEVVQRRAVGGAERRWDGHSRTAGGGRAAIVPIRLGTAHRPRAAASALEALAATRGWSAGRRWSRRARSCAPRAWPGTSPCRPAGSALAA